jgi:hypothetical protein
MAKQIKVTIDQLGNPKIEAIGFQGQGCEQATKNIEDAFTAGGGIEKEYKEEWSMSEENNNTEVEQSW